MANCCSGSTCQELVTLGYMREMVSQASLGNCITVTGGSPFLSCCTANADEYIPKYSEINPLRSFNSDPYYDANGFWVNLEPSYFNECCGYVSGNNGNISKDKLFFGYTELSDVILTHHYPYDCDITTGGTLYSIDAEVIYNRHTFGCNTYSSESASTQIPNAVTGTCAKKYSDFFIKGEWVGDSYRTVLFRNISFDDISGDYTVQRDCPSNQIVKHFSKSYDTGLTKIFYDSKTEIPCSGGILQFGFSYACGSDKMFIEGVKLYGDGNKETITANTDSYNNITSITISANFQHYTDNKLEITVSCGGQEFIYTNLPLTRNSCLLYAKNNSEMNCGLFPGTDDWSDFGTDRIIIHN